MDLVDDYCILFFLYYFGMENFGEIKNVGGEIDIMLIVMNLFGIKIGD